MTPRAHKTFIMATAILPPVGVVAGIVLLWGSVFSWVDIGILVGMYTVTALGVSAGFHRLFAHRAYKTSRPIRLILAAAGSMGAEGPLIVWASHHRRHHKFSDVEGDPHSPHLHEQEGLAGALKGLWHAHMGWLFDLRLTSEPLRYTPDLVRDKSMVWISQKFLWMVALGVVIPFFIGLAISGTLVGGLVGALIGGPIRMFFLHHFTYAVNSVGHYFGRQDYDVSDHSRNVAWLAIPSFGEGWHNNHHAFPTSARHGLKWWQVDLSGVFIHGLEKLGLAWDVVKVRPERISSKEVVPEEEYDLAGRKVAVEEE